MNTVILKRRKSLKNEDPAREEAGQQYDRERSDSDQIHLTDDLGPISMGPKKTCDDAPQKKTYFLKLVNKFCDWIHSAGLNASKLWEFDKGYNEEQKTTKANGRFIAEPTVRGTGGNPENQS